jgi:hypothetical protein
MATKAKTVRKLMHFSLPLMYMVHTNEQFDEQVRCQEFGNDKSDFR